MSELELVWALYLETGSQDRLSQVAQSAQAWCTDMGTEFSFNDYHATSATSLLPTLLINDEDFARDGSDSDSGHGGSDMSGFAADCDEGAPGLLPQVPRGGGRPRQEEHLFPDSLQVPGLCHICHNALKDVCSVLSCWKPLRDGLMMRCKIFSHIGRRERFANACILGGPWSTTEGLFEQNCPEFVETRWGSVYFVCQWFEERCKVLVGSWNAQRFGACQQEGGDDSDLANPHKVDLSIVTR